MPTNLDKYKDDLKKLISKGGMLFNSIQHECYPSEFEKAYQTSNIKEEYDEYVKKLPSFKAQYQSWYSESLSIIKQILPDRLSDFIRYYEKPKARKSIEYGNYKIEDYLENLTVTSYGKIKVDKTAALPQFEQQLNILKSLEKRFESSLFDIKQLVQADLLDSEIETAKELAKHKFLRAAGAIAGVVLEKHLHQVSENHILNIVKKNPTINDYNELLKNNSVIDTPQWRFIQHLADIRNICDHNKTNDPSANQVNDLILGVEKTIKTLF